LTDGFFRNLPRGYSQAIQKAVWWIILFNP